MKIQTVKSIEKLCALWRAEGRERWQAANPAPAAHFETCSLTNPKVASCS
jgi:hypothetical protein